VRLQALILSEYGVGGGIAQNGTVPATTADEAASLPFFGVFGSYNPATGALYQIGSSVELWRIALHLMHALQCSMPRCISRLGMVITGHMCAVTHVYCDLYSGLC
jgi:hypothetical protein